MICGEADVIDKAAQLGLSLVGAKLYTLLLPCPRCAETIVKTNIKSVVAQKHRISHNGKFDNPLQSSQKIFDDANVTYDIGMPDVR